MTMQLAVHLDILYQLSKLSLINEKSQNMMVNDWLFNFVHVVRSDILNRQENVNFYLRGMTNVLNFRGSIYSIYVYN